MSRLNSDYSLWSAAIGCTATARRMVVGRRLGQAEVADLAGGDQLGHRPDGVLDGHARVRAVQVVQVDVVDAEPLERGVAGLRHVRGRAVDAHPLPVPEDVAELGGQHDLVAAVGDGACRPAARCR